MADLDAAFEDRLQETEDYLAFLQAVEEEARFGRPRLGTSGAYITTQQQRILYSGVFLQLYNLVEATITQCLDAVTRAAVHSGTWAPSDLTSDLRREWVRVMAKTHADLNHQNRLQAALELCDHLIESLPLREFKVEKSGGSWDDAAIRAIAIRLGFELRLTPETYEGIRRPFRDNQGPLVVLKKLRNDLAHGTISFAECGANLNVDQLRDLTDRTKAYLREVLGSFTAYIEGHEYLMPTKRPGSPG